MKEPSDVVACVLDNGLFLPVALRLSKTFKHTYYWSPWEKDFPSIRDAVIGDGYETLERIKCPFGVVKDCDLFVFPDIGYALFQKYLVEQGKSVWGGRDADTLERNRGKFLTTIEEMGMPTPKYEKIVGVTQLREHLKDKEDKWVKASKWRGDVETFHWRDWRQDESQLDYYAVRLGPAKELITFYVIDPVKTDIEDGVDTFCIDGQMPKLCLHGMEAKDRAYIGTMTKFSSLPEGLRQITEAFAAQLHPYQFRQAYSVEDRIDGDDHYFIDPTLRFGSPPSQVQTNLISNLPELVWAGANGEVVEPEPSAKFGGQLMINSKEPRDSWISVEFPGSIKEMVKCKQCCEIDGMTCFPPSEINSQEIGWLVAIGDTIQEVIDTLKDAVDELPDKVLCDVAPLAELLREIESAEESGMIFTDQEVPKPEEVVK